MRRKDREIMDRDQIDRIIRASQVVRIGLSDNGQAYVVPMCFGYNGSALYLHCASQGRKLDIIARNNNVCFEFDTVLEVIAADQACGWGMRYRSVIGEGTAVIVDQAEEKIAGLKLIMSQYTEGDSTFPKQAVDNVTIIRIDIGSISGKQRL